LTSLSVVSWNVHACRGGDGVTRPDRVAVVLGRLAPAVVALQEVLSDPGPGPADQARFLAAATGLAHVEGVTLERESARYGNLLLSALPVLEVARHDLSVPGREPRGALEVLLDAGRPLRVIATHLGLSRAERRLQAALLVELVRTRTLPTLLCGDLNEPRPLGGVARRLRRAGLSGPLRRSFPARRPLLPLDRVLVSRDLMLESLVVHREPDVRVASDHLPLHARLRMETLG
jgi:endonuclease/exonuclease/phosphatase family metal-dependent hydrolase